MKRILLLIFGFVPSWAKKLGKDVMQVAELLEKGLNNDILIMATMLTPTDIDNTIRTKLIELLAKMRTDLKAMECEEAKQGVRLRAGAEILKSIDGHKERIGYYNMIMEAIYLKGVK